MEVIGGHYLTHIGEQYYTNDILNIVYLSIIYFLYLMVSSNNISDYLNLRGKTLVYLRKQG